MGNKSTQVVSLLIITFSSCVQRAMTSTCLGGTSGISAVEQSKREFLKLKGENHSIVICDLKWSSSEITTMIFRILVEEILGYNATRAPPASGSRACVYQLAGCKNPGAEADCSTTTASDIPEALVGFEMWDYLAQTAINDLANNYGEISPTRIGDMGYVGQNVFFVKPGGTTPTIPVEFYRNWQVAGNNFQSHFSQITDIPTSRLKKCEDSLLHVEKEVEQYDTHLQDSGGLETVDGKKRAVCHASYFWLGPACRSNPANCIPFMTGGDGWVLLEMMIKTAYHQLPFAITVAGNSSEYQSIPRDFNIAYYGWEPDTSFIDLPAKETVWPRHDKAEWQVGYTMTSSSDEPLSKRGHQLLLNEAPLVWQLATDLQISKKQIDAMLLDFKTIAGDTNDDKVQATACNWLKNEDNQKVWKAWFPTKRQCAKGNGLIDSAAVDNETGKHVFVLNETQGDSCSTCDPGRYSMAVIDATLQTRLCVDCPAGRHVNAYRASECSACKSGKYAKNIGSQDCFFCPIGTYASEPGSTDCTRCGLGRSSIDSWSTMEKVSSIKRSDTWVQIQGATQNTSCGCQENMQMHKGQCVPCSEGMQCPLGEVFISPGYAWDGGLSTFKCYREDNRCPGGAPGACASGRDNTSHACADCLPGFSPTDNGECSECGGPAQVLFACCVLLFIAGISFVYVLTDVSDKKTRVMGSGNAATMLVATSLSQMFVVLQTLSIIGQINVEWSGPIVLLFNVAKLIVFDIEVLKPNCIASMNATGKYGLRVLVALASVTLIVIIHFTVLGVGGILKRLSPEKKMCPGLTSTSEHSSGSGSAQPNSCREGLHVSVREKSQARLINAVGTLLLIFNISLVSTMIQPWMCDAHPNGKATLVTYPAVLCNNEGEHSDMSFIGGMCFVIPILFVVSSLWALHELPKRMLQGDVWFMKSFNFLFVRTKVKAYWYVPASVCRNMCFAIFPAFSISPLSQILSLLMIMGASQMVTVFIFPWRVHIANLLDVGGQSAILTLLALSLCFIETQDLKVASDICTAFISIVLCLAVVAAGRGIRQKILHRSNKPYQFFLCHHKQGAGCFARLLKIKLAKTPGVIGKVFIDSDDLMDLDKLLSYVAAETQTLVVLLSDEILNRVWCACEITTAHLNSVNIRVVAFHEVDLPYEKMSMDYAPYCNDVSCLTVSGITLELVEDAIDHFSQVPHLYLPEYINNSVMNSLMPILASKSNIEENQTLEVVFEQRDASFDDSKIVVIADFGKFEAMSSALTLRELLVKIQMASQYSIPIVLGKDEELPASVEHLILICTNGVFENTSVLKMLLASEGRVTIIPVLSDENFRFPHQAFLEAHRNFAAEVSPDDPDKILNLIKSVFHKIAIVFQPQLYSSTEGILETKAQEISDRLMAKNQKMLQAGVTKVGIGVDVAEAAAKSSSFQRKLSKSSSTLEAELAPFSASQTIVKLEEDLEQGQASSASHQDSTQIPDAHQVR